MPITRKQFVNQSLSYLGTPWRHTGRVINEGIDCVGLIIQSLNDLGQNIPDDSDYSLNDEFVKLVKILNTYCTKLDGWDFTPGNIILFRGRDIYNHVGIMVDDTEFIHAYSVPSVMSVQLQPLNGYWKQRIKAIYEYKEFTY